MFTARCFAADETGASLIEYSMLIGLVTVAIVTFVGAISGNLATLWSSVSAAIALATSAS